MKHYNKYPKTLFSSWTEAYFYFKNQTPIAFITPSNKDEWHSVSEYNKLIVYIDRFGVECYEIDKDFLLLRVIEEFNSLPITCVDIMQLSYRENPLSPLYKNAQELAEYLVMKERWKTNLIHTYEPETDK